MGLLVAWKESLSLLKPKNFKLLMMVTLNAIAKEWVSVMKWLMSFVLSYLLIHFLISYYEEEAFASTFSMGRYSFVFYVMIFVWCFALHPSVGRKSKYAFFSSKDVWVWAGSVLLFQSIVAFFMYYVKAHVFSPTSDFVDASNFFDWHGYYVDVSLLGWHGYLFALVALIMLNVCLIWPMLMVFFSLDSDCSLKSILYSVIRSAKMILYNFPGLMVIVTGVVGVGMFFELSLFVLLRFFMPLCSPIEVGSLVYAMLMIMALFGLMGSVIVPFIVSVISNVYIKQLYDHKDRYI